jgi:hypothetical protein
MLAPSHWPSVLQGMRDRVKLLQLRGGVSLLPSKGFFSSMLREGRRANFRISAESLRAVTSWSCPGQVAVTR